MFEGDKQTLLKSELCENLENGAKTGVL